MTVAELAYSPLLRVYHRWIAGGATEALGPVAATRPSLTPAQWLARIAFDLDAAERFCRRQRNARLLDPGEAALLAAFAKDCLGARRTSMVYLQALSSILRRARQHGGEFVLSSRDGTLGNRQTLRTLQQQLTTAGYLTSVVQSQGHGFVGPVYVWSPPPRGPDTAALEAMDVPRPAAMPECITAEDVPY